MNALEIFQVIDAGFEDKHAALIQAGMVSFAVAAWVFTILGWSRLNRFRARFGALLTGAGFSMLALAYPLALPLGATPFDSSAEFILGKFSNQTRSVSAGMVLLISAGCLISGFALTIFNLVEQIDVTKKRSLALAESQSILNSVFENLPVGIVLKDDQHVIEAVNQTYVQWYGKRAEEVIGKPTKRHESFLASEDVDKVQFYERDTLLTGRIHSRQISRTFADGKNHSLQITKFPVRDAYGAITKVGTISIDVTRLLKAEEDARNAQKAAEMANEVKSRFLAAMSHELRTPLNAILGFSEIMEAQSLGPIENAGYKSYISHIRDSGLHMLSLVDNVLNAGLIENGQGEFEASDVDISEVLFTCIERARPLALGKCIEVSAEVLGKLPLVRADIDAARQIIENILSNAIEFNRPGGKVIVILYETKAGVTIRFADTGSGYSIDQVEQIKQPAAQVQHDPYLAQPGIGLRLTIAQSLIGVQGGDLEIESQSGQGTTVIATFSKALDQTATG